MAFDKDSLQKFSALIGAPGTAVMIYGLNKGIGWLAVLGGLFLSIAIFIFTLATVLLKNAKKEIVNMGDNFINNGENFGHMGNVTNNYQKGAFSFGQYQYDEILRISPKGCQIKLTGYGLRPSSMDLARVVVQNLERDGFNVEFSYFGQVVGGSAPERPFEASHYQGVTYIKLAPEL